MSTRAPGPLDRRQRLLYSTAKGARLARELAALQSARFCRVLEELDPAARDAAAAFLFAMVNVEERVRVRAHFGRRELDRAKGYEGP